MIKAFYIFTFLLAFSFCNQKIIQKNVALKFVSIHDTCKECREVGDTLLYRILVHIRKNNLGCVRVRKDASCFEVPNCEFNVVGKIKDDLWVYASGPLKNAEFSAGIAYAIIVKDLSSKFSRGYLSESVIDSIRFFLSRLTIALYE